MSGKQASGTHALGVQYTDEGVDNACTRYCGQCVVGPAQIHFEDTDLKGGSSKHNKISRFDVPNVSLGPCGRYAHNPRSENREYGYIAYGSFAGVIRTLLYSKCL